MKSTAIVFALVVVTTSRIHGSEYQEGVHQETFGKHPTKTTSITFITEEGPIEDYGEFTELMERRVHRKLQTAQTGAGYGNDPAACEADGVRFTCVAPSLITFGENITQVTSTISCLLNDQSTTDFQASENCTCNALLEQPVVNTTQVHARNCACAVCPKGSKQAVSMDCSMVVEDPYIYGLCNTLDCDGRCNGRESLFPPSASPASLGDPVPGSAAIAPQTTVMASTIFGSLVSSLVWTLL
jgi:hypothetical protein